MGKALMTGTGLADRAINLLGLLWAKASKCGKWRRQGGNDGNGSRRLQQKSGSGHRRRRISSSSHSTTAICWPSAGAEESILPEEEIVSRPSNHRPFLYKKEIGMNSGKDDSAMAEKKKSMASNGQHQIEAWPRPSFRPLTTNKSSPDFRRIESLLGLADEANHQLLQHQPSSHGEQTQMAAFIGCCSPLALPMASTLLALRPQLWPVTACIWPFLWRKQLVFPIHQMLPSRSISCSSPVEHYLSQTITNEMPLAMEESKQPPTAAAIEQRAIRGQKLNKRRHAFSAGQTCFLEKQFRVHRYISGDQRANISALLGLSQQQVKIWFQNRRYKEKTGGRKSRRP